MKLENLSVRELSAQVQAATFNAILKYLTKEQKESLDEISVGYVSIAPYDPDDEDSQQQVIEVLGKIEYKSGGQHGFSLVLSWDTSEDVLFANLAPQFD